MTAKINELHHLLLPLLLLASPILMGATQEDVILTISVESEHINTYESTGVLVSLTNRAGEPLVGQEISFTTDRGKVDPNRAITNAGGEVWVTFIASGQPGVSYIIASARGMSEFIIVTIAPSTFQWIVFVFLCLLGLLGIVVLFQRRRRKLNQDEW